MNHTKHRLFHSVPVDPKDVEHGITYSIFSKDETGLLHEMLLKFFRMNGRDFLFEIIKHASIHPGFIYRMTREWIAKELRHVPAVIEDHITGNLSFAPKPNEKPKPLSPQQLEGMVNTVETANMSGTRKPGSIDDKLETWAKQQRFLC